MRIASSTLPEWNGERSRSTAAARMSTATRAASTLRHGPVYGFGCREHFLEARRGCHTGGRAQHGRRCRAVAVPGPSPGAAAAVFPAQQDNIPSTRAGISGISSRARTMHQRADGTSNQLPLLLRCHDNCRGTQSGYGNLGKLPIPDHRAHRWPEQRARRRRQRTFAGLDRWQEERHTFPPFLPRPLAGSGIRPDLRSSARGWCGVSSVPGFHPPLLLRLLLLGLLAAGATYVVRRALVGYLVVSDSLAPADVILVLNSPDPVRAVYAAHLYRQGLAPSVTLVQAEVRMQDVTRFATALLVGRGVDAADMRIIPFGEGATSTMDEAVAFARWMESEGNRSAIVVTHRFHSRRARWAVATALEGSGVRIVMAPVPQDFAERHSLRGPDGRPLRPLGSWLHAQELVKLIYYRLVY